MENKKVLEFEFKDFLNKNIKIDVLDICSLENLKRLSNNCSSIKSRCEGIKVKENKYNWCLELEERINKNIVKLGGKGRSAEVKVLDSLDKVEKELNNVRSKLCIKRGKGIVEGIKELENEEKRLLELKKGFNKNSVSNVVENKIKELEGLKIKGGDNKNIDDMIKILMDCMK